MMDRNRTAVSLALLIAAPLLGAQQMSVDSIVSRHLAARGGVERLRSLHSVVYRNGAYHEGSYTSDGKAFMAMARPYYKIVGDPTDTTGEYLEGYDGGAWEWTRDPGYVVRTVGAANAAIRHNLDPEGPFFDYRAKGSTVERAADAVIGDRRAYGLLLTLRDGHRDLYFIDKESFLISAVRKTAPIHAFGKAVTTEERFSDYRNVDGILFSFRSAETDIATGKELNSMRWGVIEANRELPRAWFSPPTGPRTPFQDLLERLYEERTDTLALRWTYFAYRRARADDTRAGVEDIGYEMLKAGAYPGAITLLSLNVTDYPRSSSAAFGLGRAYATAGDGARARREFERALSLDPTNKRATDALGALKSGDRKGG